MTVSLPSSALPWGCWPPGWCSSTLFRQRVPEKNLLLLAVVGGSVGALLGMYLFRHKTLHRVFRVGVPVILAVQLLLAAAIALYWNFLQ